MKKYNTKKLLFLIIVISIIFLSLQIYMYNKYDANFYLSLIMFFYVICSCILLGFLILYQYSDSTKIKNNVQSLAEKFLHKYLKGWIARNLLIVIYITGVVLLGWFCITLLKHTTASEMHAGAFAGAVFGSLFASAIELIKRTNDKWDEMTPSKYLKRFVLFLLISFFSWLFNDVFVLYTLIQN